MRNVIHFGGLDIHIPYAPMPLFQLLEGYHSLDVAKIVNISRLTGCTVKTSIEN
jgi:hypothetical protein